MTTQVILVILEGDNQEDPGDVVLFPPEEKRNLSDEDSGDEDHAIKDANNIGKGILNEAK